jgi:hypothetical protein
MNRTTTPRAASANGKATPSPNGTSTGRLPDGRFARGCKGGPGNPHGRAVGLRRTAFLNAITVADLEEIARKLVAMAKAGDVAAAGVLLRYSIGRPPEVNPDRADLDELKLFGEVPGPWVAAGLANLVSAGLAVQIARDGMIVDKDALGALLAKLSVAQMTELQGRQADLDAKLKKLLDRCPAAEGIDEELRRFENAKDED